MSGGSFDYFYYRAPESLRGIAGDLERMADVCHERAAGPPEKHYATGELIDLVALGECADYLKFLATRTRAIATVLEKSADITQAVEWWKSCDSGIDHIVEVWRKLGSPSKGEDP